MLQLLGIEQIALQGSVHCITLLRAIYIEIC